MLTQICRYLKNWFERDKWPDDYKISGGVLTYADGTSLPLLDGQYYRIVGSVLNEGVHRWGDAEDALSDENFSGAVWPMAVPKAVAELAAEIAAWSAKYADAAASPFQSETTPVYSYAKGYTGGSINVISWQSQFKAQLAPWRKL